MADFQIMGMPVWVYSKDIDTKGTIVRAQLIQGHVGESFSIDPQDIDGYRFVSSEGTLTGVFSEKDMFTVTFFYQRENVAETESLTNKYLHIFTEVQPVISVQDQTATGQKLWPGTVVKASERMASKTGEFWYQLADSRWVKYDMKAMKLTNDDGRSQQPAMEWQPATEWQPIPYAVNGVIDYIPGASVTVYSQPYGREIGKIAHGTAVEVIEKVIDTARVTWYHVAQQGWISSIYVKLGA